MSKKTTAGQAAGATTKKRISLKEPGERGLVLRLLKRIIQENGRQFLRQYVMAIVCLVLVAASFLVLRATEGEGTNSTYIPPKYEDGKIVPAQNIPKE